MLVSIVIPVYNAEEFIEEAINSIERQTCDYEAIFIDDGSTDRSGEIIQKYVTRNPRLRYIRQENAGANHARGKGVSAANGEWITFVDADDLISSNFSNICDTLCKSYSGDIIATATDVNTPPLNGLPIKSRGIHPQYNFAENIYRTMCQVISPRIIHNGYVQSANGNNIRRGLHNEHPTGAAVYKRHTDYTAKFLRHSPGR